MVCDFTCKPRQTVTEQHINMKETIIILSLTWLAIGCEQKTDPDKLLMQSEIDSLNLALEVQSYNNVLLEQVGKYLDSIDLQKNWIEINLETGLAENDYLERMSRLSLYVQKAEWTIQELEKTRSAFASQVKRLKREIVEKDEEVQKLLGIIETIADENETLQGTLQISETELIAAKLELFESEAKLYETLTLGQQLKQNLTVTKAEAFFRQGENKEELASHIQLAPKKKRKSLEEALTLYNKALAAGYEPAQMKVAQLTERLQK
ncbi:MAG: hypothetical protein ACI8QD_001361 [Cyclobacteriaceae bacterium]